jgi:hypothetical protein
MNPEDKESLEKHLREISAILLKNTPPSSLEDFESIEVAVRDHILTEVGPVIGSFFVKRPAEPDREESEKSRVLSGE